MSTEGQQPPPPPRPPPPVYTVVPMIGHTMARTAPPPYEQLQEDAELGHPPLPLPAYGVQNAPERGRLASKGTVRWWRRSQGVDLSAMAQQLGEPGPPESVIEARRYRCSICNSISYVRDKDFGRRYIVCPYCKIMSTLDLEKTMRSYRSCFAAGIILAVLGIVVIILFVIRSSDDHRHARVVTPFLTSVLMFKYASVYRKIPLSTIEDNSVLYWPSVEEIEKDNKKKCRLCL